MDTKRLPRLIAIDHWLAGDGLHLQTAAQELGVTVRTLWRDLEILRQAGCQIECRIVDSRYLHFHVGERLFNSAYGANEDDTENMEDAEDAKDADDTETPADDVPCEHEVHENSV